MLSVMQVCPDPICAIPIVDKREMISVSYIMDIIAEIVSARHGDNI